MVSQYRRRLATIKTDKHTKKSTEIYDDEGQAGKLRFPLGLIHPSIQINIKRELAKFNTITILEN